MLHDYVEKLNDDIIEMERKVERSDYLLLQVLKFIKCLEEDEDYNEIKLHYDGYKSNNYKDLVDDILYELGIKTRDYDELDSNVDAIIRNGELLHHGI